MRWISIIAVLALGLLLYYCAPSKRHVDQLLKTSIPLDHIWATEMPGTQDIRDLEPDKFGEHTRRLSSEDQARLEQESKLEQIGIALSGPRDKDERAKPGFAVLGTAAEAFQGAYDVVVKGEKPEESFPSVSNVTLVFYSYLCGEYVHIEHVGCQGTRIEIQYEFVPHMSQIMSWHVALIPLGKLQRGTYEVNMVQLPVPKAPGVRRTGLEPEARVNRIICRPFSFSVYDGWR